MRMMQNSLSSVVHSEIKKMIPSPRRLGARVFLLTAVLLPFLSSPGGRAFAGSATWNLNPTSGDWNTAANWTPATVPNGPNDTATFGVSNTTNVSDDLVPIEVNSIVFTPGASAYTISTIQTIDHILTISGVGITNNSGITQNFIAGNLFFEGSGFISFTNNATAGSLTAFSIAPPGLEVRVSSINFFDTSSAGSGTFTNYSSSDGETVGASTSFYGTSTAANGTFINYGSTANGTFCGGSTFFNETSTAGNATLIAYPDTEFPCPPAAILAVFTFLLIPPVARHGWRFSAAMTPARSTSVATTLRV